MACIRRVERILHCIISFGIFSTSPKHFQLYYYLSSGTRSQFCLTYFSFSANLLILPDFNISNGKNDQVTWGIVSSFEYVLIYQSQWPGRCHALNGLYGINVICILLCKVDTLSGVHCLLRYRERNKSIKIKVAGEIIYIVNFMLGWKLHLLDFSSNALESLYSSFYLGI